MIKVLPESLGALIGLKIKGRLTHEEYAAVVPILENSIKVYGKIRILLDIQGFKGWGLKAALDDMLFAFKNREAVERVAIICEQKSDTWVTLIDQPFTRGSRGKGKYFNVDEYDEAWVWLKKGMPPVLSDKATAVASKKRRMLRTAPDLNLLIVGLTPTALLITNLLQHWGVKVTLVAGSEPEEEEALVCLWSMGLGPLSALGHYKALLKQGQCLTLESAEGWPFHALIEKYGSVLQIQRAKLVSVLTEALEKGVIKAKAFHELAEGADGVEVAFTKGKAACYDAVLLIDQPKAVAADRVLVFKTSDGPLALSLSFNAAWALVHEIVRADNVQLPQVCQRFNRILAKSLSAEKQL